jgi:DNA-binding IclR family transcriptional regulator
MGEPQRFYLGPAVLKLAKSGPESPNLASLARPVLARLHETTGETVALFVPIGNLRQCVVELPSSNPLSFKRGVGYKDRIIYGASGRAILAQLLGPLLTTSPRNEAALKAELQSYAAGSSADISAYPEELCRIRQRGYAVSRNELIHGAVAVASPIFDKLQQVAGSIAVFGPSVRLPADQVKRYGALLVEAGREISAALSQAQ